MGIYDKPLAEHQIALLQWVQDGCPDGVVSGTSYKTIAVALQSRRLVKISRTGGGWNASITPEGQYYLQHGRFRERKERLQVHVPPRPRVLPAPQTAPARIPPRVPPTVQLINDVIEAGGELHVDSHEDKRDFRTLVATAIRYNKVPPGKLLTMDRGETWREVIIKLQDPPEWQTKELATIPVPARLQRPHRLLHSIESAPQFTVLTKLVRPRARRLLHALITEAETCGYEIIARDVSDSYNREPSLFGIAVAGHAIGVAIAQDVDRTPHEPTPAELRAAERGPWLARRIPKFDSHPSNRLILTVINGSKYRQASWSDGKRGQLDARLAEILQEVELRAAALEDQRLERVRQQQERQRQWEAAMERAHRDLVESHRADMLVTAAQTWQRAGLLRDYIGALRQRADQLAPGEERDAAQEWIAWSSAYAERLDPLHRTLAMPADPEPTPEQLKPFLNGWSPYGPNGY